MIPSHPEEIGEIDTITPVQEQPDISGIFFILICEIRKTDYLFDFFIGKNLFFRPETGYTITAFAERILLIFWNEFHLMGEIVDHTP
jgi:hypothetical protein